MENDVQELVQVQNTSMNSILKQKMHKGSISNSENYMTLKQETTKAIKVLQEVMTIMEKQD